MALMQINSAPSQNLDRAGSRSNPAAADRPVRAVEAAIITVTLHGRDAEDNLGLDRSARASGFVTLDHGNIAAPSSYS